jgi:hypothetical protein
MGKGTGEAKSGTIEMVMMKPVPTDSVQTDEDMTRFIHGVRQSIAHELSSR